MQRKKTFWANIRHDIGPILYRNVISLIALIIGLVVTLLLVFGEIREGLFLASVLFLNIVIGVIQELRAKIALEKLQALMVQKVIRLNADGTQETIPIEEIMLADHIELHLGDQVPADSIVAKTSGLEVNEALLTGESDNILKKPGDEIFAGSFVVAGSAIVEVKTLPEKSFVSEMTKKIKEYSVSQSPIQYSIGKFITYMGYLYLGIVIFVSVRGQLSGRLFIQTLKEIAALAGIVVPEGMILATTLLFAYGSIRLFQQHVLLQQINAVESLGRIENLCVDKTGTLTENQPVLESVIPYDNNSPGNIAKYIATYIKETGDTSQTILAIEKDLDIKNIFTVSASLPFSSNRKYGAIRITEEQQEKTIVVGAPDILKVFITNPEQLQWLESNIDQYASAAKRLLLLCEGTQTFTDSLPSHSQLSILALYVLSNPLRAGTQEIINYFQKRGVKVRVISGDNPKTVQAIAHRAGIEQSEHIISGADMTDWKEEDYALKIDGVRLFARIRPEQKEKIIETLKKRGFTAMVGDGANDALAIKKADLGIAMFDGSSATRQIAQIVLMNNSFAALPKGVQLADSIISTLEMIGSIFFNKVMAGLAFFVALSFIGAHYPISPRNMTVINYITIGLPVFYWALFPSQKGRHLHDTHILKRILPFSILNGLLTMVACLLVYFFSSQAILASDYNVLVVLTFAALGYWFFVLVPYALDEPMRKRQKMTVSIIAAVIILILFLIFKTPVVADFFGLQVPEAWDLLLASGVVVGIGAVQYWLVHKKVANRILQKRLLKL